MIEYFGLTILILGGVCFGTIILSFCIKEIKQTCNAIVMLASSRC